MAIASEQDIVRQTVFNSVYPVQHIRFIILFKPSLDSNFALRSVNNEIDSAIMMALLIIMRGMVLLEALFTKWPSTVRRLYFTEECGPQLFGRITWPDTVVVFAAFAVHTLHSPKFERIALHATALFPQVQICEVCLQKRQTVVRIPPDWNANGAVYQTNKKVSNSGRALRLKVFVWSSSSAVLLGLSV